MEPSSDISIESVEENILKSSLNRVRKRKKQLYTDLKKQMEFYLSDANLRKDRFFGNLMQTSQCKLYCYLIVLSVLMQKAHIMIFKAIE